MKCSIDWLSVTFPCIKTLDELCRILKVLQHWQDCFTTERRSKNNYQLQHMFNSIIVLAQDLQYKEFRENMGVHLLLSGSACNEFVRCMNVYANTLESGKYEWKDFFIDCLKLGANFTRIDIALDDIICQNSNDNLKLDFNKVIKSIENGNIVSRFKKSQIVSDTKLADGSTEGKTIYFGKRQSDMMFRFYDKKQEQISKNKLLDETIEKWQRYEIEAKHSLAHDLVRTYISSNISLPAIAIGVFSDWLDFKDARDTDTNKSRRKTAEWWIDFIETYEQVELSSNNAKSTYESMVEWIETSVSKSLYTATEIEGIDFIEQLLEKGKEKCSEADLLQIQNRKTKQLLIKKKKKTLL